MADAAAGHQGERAVADGESPEGRLVIMLGEVPLIQLESLELLHPAAFALARRRGCGHQRARIVGLHPVVDGRGGGRSDIGGLGGVGHRRIEQGGRRLAGHRPLRSRHRPAIHVDKASGRVPSGDRGAVGHGLHVLAHRPLERCCHIEGGAGRIARVVVGVGDQRVAERDHGGVAADHGALHGGAGRDAGVGGRHGCSGRDVVDPRDRQRGAAYRGGLAERDRGVVGHEAVAGAGRIAGDRRGIGAAIDQRRGKPHDRVAAVRVDAGDQHRRTVDAGVEAADIASHRNVDDARERQRLVARIRGVGQHARRQRGHGGVDRVGGDPHALAELRDLRRAQRRCELDLGRRVGDATADGNPRRQRHGLVVEIDRVEVRVLGHRDQPIGKAVIAAVDAGSGITESMRRGDDREQRAGVVIAIRRAAYG